MGLFDNIIGTLSNPIEEMIGIDLPDSNQLLDIATEFDPTHPGAEYGEETGIVLDIAANVVTDGAAGTVVSDTAEGIGHLNEATDNSFTLENIGEAIGGLFS